MFDSTSGTSLSCRLPGPEQAVQRQQAAIITEKVKRALFKVLCSFKNCQQHESHSFPLEIQIQYNHPILNCM